MILIPASKVTEQRALRAYANDATQKVSTQNRREQLRTHGSSPPVARCPVSLPVHCTAHKLRKSTPSCHTRDKTLYRCNRGCADFGVEPPCQSSASVARSQPVPPPHRLTEPWMHPSVRDHTSVLVPAKSGNLGKAVAGRKERFCSLMGPTLGPSGRQAIGLPPRPRLRPTRPPMILPSGRPQGTGTQRGFLTTI